MQHEIHDGFLVLDSGRQGPCYVCPHSGIHIRDPKSRDAFTEVIGFELAKTSGRSVLSTLPRDQDFGIDFFRRLPEKKDALRFHKYYEREDWDSIYKFRSTYAFVAKKGKDFEAKRKIYKKFWKAAHKNNGYVIAVHNTTTRIKNHPTILDLISFENRGCEKSKLEKIADILNKKYKKEFKAIKKYYDSYLLLNSYEILEENRKHFGTIKKSRGLFRENVIKDMKMAEKILGKKVKFTDNDYMKSVKEAIRIAQDPKITVEKNFSGKMGFAMFDMIPDNLIKIELEINEAIMRYKPVLTGKIIHDVLGLYQKV
jgi:hypothetical protein